MNLSHRVGEEFRISSICVEQIGSKLWKEISAQEELWLERNMRLHFPGIFSLVLSGQKRLAMRMMQVFGIHVAVFPDGAKELRMNNQVIDSINFRWIWDGVKMEKEYNYYAHCH